MSRSISWVPAGAPDLLTLSRSTGAPTSSSGALFTGRAGARHLTSHRGSKRCSRSPPTSASSIATGRGSTTTGWSCAQRRRPDAVQPRPEIDAPQASGIEYEVVPGVTAALGASAELGISLTRRGVSRSVVFATPRIGKDQENDGIGSWAKAVAAADTAVLYMSRGEAPQLVDALRAAGLPADHPAAIVESASRCSAALVRTLEQLRNVRPKPLVGPPVSLAACRGCGSGGRQLRTAHDLLRTQRPSACATSLSPHCPASAGLRSRRSVLRNWRIDHYRCNNITTAPPDIQGIHRMQATSFVLVGRPHRRGLALAGHAQEPAR